MRIAGGVRAILTYADRLARRGHAVTVVVPAKGSLSAWWRNLKGAEPDWVPGFQPRVRWVGDLSASSLPDGDVIVATAWQTARPVNAAPARCGRKFYLIQHYESLYHGKPEEVDRTYTYPLRKMVISTWLKEIMREKFQSDAELLVTPVDPALFSRLDPGPDDGLARVLMLRHDYAWKGVADGLEAVRRVKARHPEVRLVGFGVKRARQREAYDEYYENLPQERLAWLYSRCPIYLCPSWDEGLGMPSMEAMACGAALVTYDNGGCRDYALDGRTALVARRRDVADLAGKLELLVADAALRAKLAREGMALIKREFDWERAVAKMEGLFRADSS
ncbi:MAG: glycosyltransferase family 4 protein [Candidatus Rokubacteria bacterium]|nr:glycosyltransferase family 4 protein [Candidatus Rokubacteria bacterium]